MSHYVANPNALALWQLTDDGWLEMRRHHRPELLQLGGGPVLDWRCAYEPVISCLRCRQIERKAEEQAALRAADAAAQRRHADATFLEMWQSLNADQHKEIRSQAANF